MKRKNLKTHYEYYDVYISPDRTPDQQKAHKELVKKLKEKIQKEPDRRFYIRGGQILCDDSAKKATINREEDCYYMFDHALQKRLNKQIYWIDSRHVHMRM